MVRCFGLLALLVSGVLLMGDTVGAGGGEKKKKFDSDQIFQRLDANSDGKISKDELLKLAERTKEDKDKVRENLTKVYEKLDPDNKGLTKEQLGEAMKELFKRRTKDK